MNEYWAALLLAMLPASGNFAGGMLAEVVAVSQRMLSLAQHAAAGVVLAVVAVEFMPEAMQAASPWMVVLAFVAGGAFLVAVDHGLAIARMRAGTSGREGGPWLIFVGVAIGPAQRRRHDRHRGQPVGRTGPAARSGPGARRHSRGFRDDCRVQGQGVPRRTRLALSATFAIPILLGTTIGYVAVRDQPEVVKLALLAFTAGALTTVVVEEIVPEAHVDGEARSTALVFVGAFALFALLSAYMG